MNKSTYTHLAIISIGLITLILLLNKCDNNPTSVHNYPLIIDNKLAEIEALKLYISKQDSVINAKQDTVIVYRTKFKTKYDTLYKQAPDTCKPYLSELNRYCTKLDSVNQSLITSQTTLIDTLKHQVTNYIVLDSVRTNFYNDSIVKLSKEIKKLKNKALLNWFKGGVIGFGAGYFTGKFI